MASFTVVDDEAPELSLMDRLIAPPGLSFHITFGVGVLGALWAASSPSGYSVSDPFGWVGLAVVAAWAIRMGFALSRNAFNTAFLIVPVALGVLAAGAYFEVPQETRWMQAEGGFEKALRSLPQAKEWDQAVADETVPGRIGSYWLDGVSRDSAGMVQFHLSNGLLGVGDAAGSAFTYLVDGPTEKVAEANPGATFDHVHGNWYIVRH